MAFEVIGNDTTIAFAAEAGQLQLNAFLPMIANSLFKSLLHLRRACQVLARRCVRGITANAERMEAMAKSSISLVTALSPYLGYEAATRIATEAHESGESVYNLVLRKNLLNQQDLDRILSPENLIRPVAIRHDRGS